MHVKLKTQGKSYQVGEHPNVRDDKPLHHSGKEARTMHSPPKRPVVESHRIPTQVSLIDS